MEYSGLVLICSYFLQMTEQNLVSRLVDLKGKISKSLILTIYLDFEFQIIQFE